MTIFHFTFFFIMTLNLITKPKNSQQGRKVFCVLSGIIYFALAALRGYHVGYDTYNYYYTFKALSRFQSAPGSNFGKDPFFYFFMWIVRQFTNNYSVFLFIIALVFTVSFWTYVYLYSDDPCFSVVFLLAFNLYQFTLTGQRQTMAMSFILLALISLRKEKKIWALILVLIAAQFHKSAYIFYLLFLLYKCKLGKKILFLSIPALLFVFVDRINIANKLMPYLSERGYILNATSSGYTMAFVIFALYVFAVVFHSGSGEQKDDLSLGYWMMMIAVAFEMLVPAQNIFFRFAFYFLPEGSVLIPKVVSFQKNRNNYAIINGVLYLLLSVQYLFFTLNSSGVTPYSFFWE